MFCKINHRHNNDNHNSLKNLCRSFRILYLLYLVVDPCFNVVRCLILYLINLSLMMSNLSSWGQLSHPVGDKVLHFVT